MTDPSPSSLAAHRAAFEEAGLHRDDLVDDPIAQFDRWFTDAQRCGLYQPEAMAVASVDGGGQPSARLVLLRGVDDRGFVFFTNYDSRKGTELDAQPRAALLFGWHELGRQVRIEGAVARVSDAESDAYFSTRPRGSQLGAWASPQSQVIADRATLDTRADEQEQRWAGHDAIERPPHWGGYRVAPEVIELWQGRRDRLHDRFRYTRAGTGWRLDRLAP